MSRLDRALVERGLARSRAQAASLIEAGQVRVNGVVAAKATQSIRAGDLLQAATDPDVSRGAAKLRGALADLALGVRGRVLDAGASTGGFTQVLLESGCSRVYAVDVGSGQLVSALRADPRVVVHEQTNLRDLTLAHVEDEPVDLVVADVSFISLTLLVEPLAAVTRPDGRLLLMVKPQFEVGRELLGHGGVVADPALQRQAVEAVAAAAARIGWSRLALTPSRLPGRNGNQESFLLLARYGGANPQLPESPGAAAYAVAGE